MLILVSVKKTFVKRKSILAGWTRNLEESQDHGASRESVAQRKGFAVNAREPKIRSSRTHVQRRHSIPPQRIGANPDILDDASSILDPAEKPVATVQRSVLLALKEINKLPITGT
jgi:hypothetical protein